MMTNLTRYIGQKLANGGIVVGARDKGDYIEFRVVIDGETEVHDISKKVAA